MKIQNSGLRKLPIDHRDYSHAKTFRLGAAPLPPLPPEYILLSTLENQLSTDECSAFSSSAVRDTQKGIEFSEDYMFSKEKQIEGTYKTFGADLRMPCQAAITYGFLPKTIAPDMTSAMKGRDFIANWENWDIKLDSEAIKYRPGGYFAVDGNFDMFDNIRSAMWHHQDEKVTVFVGATWFDEWTEAPGGIIPSVYRNVAGGHAFKIAGWKTINGIPYLVCQNSYGAAFGDNGLFYFSREIVNKEFTYGAYYFLDNVPQQVANVGIAWAILQRIKYILMLMSKSLGEIFNH